MERKKKYDLNHGYFDLIDCKEKAYFLGLLYADGCNDEGKKHINLNLSDPDGYMVKRFAKAIQITKGVKILDRSSIGYKNSNILYFTSHKMSSRLTELGCWSKKGLTKRFPVDLFSEDLMSHFLRGYIDGNGSVAIRKKTNILTLVVSSSLYFCEGLKNFVSIKFNGGGYINKRKTKNPNEFFAKLSYNGSILLERFYDWLYTDSEGLRLERKYNIFKEFKKNKKKQTKQTVKE